MQSGIFDIVQETLMVSGFVLFMMLIIEYVNVRSKGTWSKLFKKSPPFQIFIASLFGSIPGCVGTFTVVSLYTHNIINFSALFAGLVATVGDEAFVMISIIPGTAWKIIFIVLCLGLISGFILHLLFGKKTFIKDGAAHLEVHDEEGCSDCFRGNILDNLRQISFHRALIIAVLLMMVMSQVAVTGPDGGIIFPEWETFLFFAGAAFSLYIIVSVPDHFLQEHLWGHVIRKHFLRIFLWTLGAISCIALLYYFFDIETWVQGHVIYVLFAALLIGMIPVSGPHIIFISLFAEGAIPFSVLLANSIMQDGHGGLPLLAESKRSFLILKLIKLIPALAIGLAGIYL